MRHRLVRTRETIERPTDIPGVRLFVRPAHPDQRGSFRRVFSEAEYSVFGITDDFVEDNVSVSKGGVLRGLHYDFRLAKFVQVLEGEIFDVVVDVRRESPTFGRWQGFHLSAQGCEQLYVPRGFAHGFYVLSEKAIVSYKQSGAYDPATEGQVLWNDPEIGIAWPLVGAPIVSAKDAAALPLSAVPRYDLLVAIFDGNSLTAGVPGNASADGPNISFPNGTDFPSAAMRKLGANWRGFNVGVGSRQLDETPGDAHTSPPGTTQIEDFERTVAPRIREAWDSGAVCVIVVNFGEPGNLLYYATVDNKNGGTRARKYAYEAVRKYGALVRAAGALFVQLTVPARAHEGSQNLQFLEDLDAVNQMLISRWQADDLCDALIDLTPDPRFVNTSDPACYAVGGTHFTEGSYDVVARYVVPVLKELAASKAPTA